MITYLGDVVFNESLLEQKDRSRALASFPENFSKLVGLKEKFDL
jgi:hypothetical protein